MHAYTVQVETKARAATTWTAIATVLLLALAGCAADLGPRPGNPASEAAAYIGMFTGEFVDGRPLYRFPAIHVVGSRSSVGPDL